MKKKNDQSTCPLLLTKEAIEDFNLDFTEANPTTVIESANTSVAIKLMDNLRKKQYWKRKKEVK